MYWSRTGSIIDLLLWVMLSILWVTGGWLLSRHLFHLRPRERFFSGIAIGLLLFVVSSNLFARILPLSTAYWVAAMVVLAFGVVAAWHSNTRPWFDVEDLHIWPQILTFASLLILFGLINRGLAIFDDYHNLPLISMMATGDVPPHFYLNAEQLMDYHYGLHLFGASLIRIAGFFPWSALDLSKSISMALALILAWLWFRRLINNNLACFLAVLLILFAAGARWLLLFVPEGSLIRMSSEVELMGSARATAPDLYTALLSPWNIEGGGPFPYPFAFANGIFPPSLPSIGGSGALPQMTIFLLLLLARRSWRPFPGLISALVFASLALTSENLFSRVWLGILLAIFIGMWVHRSLSRYLNWGWVLLPSALIGISAGGVLTQTIPRWIAPIFGASPTSGISFTSFSLRWPPSILSSHLGYLSLTDPQQLLIAVFEMGPVLILAPWVTWLTVKRVRTDKLIIVGLSLAAIIGLFSSLFLELTDRSRDITRLAGSALSIWLLLGIPYLWWVWRRGNQLTRFVIGVGYAITVLSGIAFLPPNLIAMGRIQYSYFVQEPDAQMSKIYWDNLDRDASILDPAYPFRPPTLFGRSAGVAYQSVYIPFPEFKSLLVDLNPVEIARSGYSYIYLDKKTWQDLSDEQHRLFHQSCVKQIAEQRTEMNDFRWLFDIRECQ